MEFTMVLKPLRIKKCLFVALFFAWLISGCKEERLDVAYQYSQPDYDSVWVGPTSDTIDLPFQDDFYNNLKMHCFFEAAGVGYLALYDVRSQSVSVYDFDQKRVVYRLFLKRIIDQKDLYKPSVYVKNFDTIVVANKGALYIVDSSGKRKFHCSLPKDNAANFTSLKAPFVSQEKIWIPERVISNDNSPKIVKAQRLFFNIDLPGNRISERYPLPSFYWENVVAQKLIFYYSCINADNRTVLSFRADSTLYETDLLGFNQSYFARSRFQKEPIIADGKLAATVYDKKSEEFRSRHTYGPVYFDKYTERYLRVSYLGMSPDEFKATGNRRSQSIAVLDKNFRIVGEQRIDSTIYTDFMFFDQRGNLYARFKSSDEYAIHFVKLAYAIRKGEPEHLSKR